MKHKVFKEMNETNGITIRTFFMMLYGKTIKNAFAASGLEYKKLLDGFGAEINQKELCPG